MDRTEIAKELFLSGYNCSQAVFAAFGDLTGIDKETSLKIASPFGGGIGRMREVCGAFSGMLMAFGALYGNPNANDNEAKQKNYKTVQDFAEEFKSRCGSIICREILKNPPSDPVPTPRNEKFYKERPCVRMVMTATDILENYIINNKK